MLVGVEEGGEGSELGVPRGEMEPEAAPLFRLVRADGAAEGDGVEAVLVVDVGLDVAEVRRRVGTVCALQHSDVPHDFARPVPHFGDVSDPCKTIIGCKYSVVP